MPDDLLRDLNYLIAWLKQASGEVDGITLFPETLVGRIGDAAEAAGLPRFIRYTEDRPIDEITCSIVVKVPHDATAYVYPIWRRRSDSPRTQLNMWPQQRRQECAHLLEGWKIIVEQHVQARPAKNDQQPLTVLLRGRTLPAVVIGKEKTLTAAQYDVVEALIGAKPQGLTKDQLESKSGRGDARGILVRLRKKDADWATVIHMAEVTGGRYRID